MPRLTSRVFVDLAIWMTGFGLAIGVVFPPFCLVLGLPPERILTPLFFASTLTAGLVVGAVNFGLAYGMNAWGLAQRLDIAPDEAQEIIDGYFAGFPKIKAYLEVVVPVDADEQDGVDAARISAAGRLDAIRGDLAAAAGL